MLITIIINCFSCLVFQWPLLLNFIKKKNIGNIINPDKTVKFTYLLNLFMFDSINRKYPAEGIKKNSHDMEVFYVECL